MSGERDVTKLSRALMRELNDSMKSPRGDFYQGDVTDPHRTQHIIERHMAAALTPAPDVAALREALAGVLALVNDGLLVRNTTNDAHFPSYVSESTRLVKALAAAQAALAVGPGEGKRHGQE